MLLAAAMSLTCSSSSQTYTLYRNSVVNDSLRVHVATFDAGESEIYNRDICNEVSALMHAKSGPVKLRYWCEKGRYRK